MAAPFGSTTKSSPYSAPVGDVATNSPTSPTAPFPIEQSINTTAVIEFYQWLKLADDAITTNSAACKQLTEAYFKAVQTPETRRLVRQIKPDVLFDILQIGFFASRPLREPLLVATSESTYGLVRLVIQSLSTGLLHKHGLCLADGMSLAVRLAETQQYRAVIYNSSKAAEKRKRFVRYSVCKISLLLLLAARLKKLGKNKTLGCRFLWVFCEFSLSDIAAGEANGLTLDEIETLQLARFADWADQAESIARRLKTFDEVIEWTESYRNLRDLALARLGNSGKGSPSRDVQP